MSEQVVNNDVTNTDNEKKLLHAFVGKPEKFKFYEKASETLKVGNGYSIGWCWSWWAFFAGWVFLLYRKAYLAALGSFVISILLSLVPFFGFLLYMVLSGGISTYFVLDRFAKLKKESQNSELSDQIRVMNNFGGYHSWVAWVFGILYGIGIILIIAGIFGLELFSE